MTFDSPVPFDEAIKVAQQKGYLPNNLPFAVLARMKSQFLQRATFSARMDKIEPLVALQKMFEQISGGNSIDDENGRIRSIPEAKAQLREAMYRAGVELAPVGTPKIKDFFSDTRRQLMVQTTVLDTMGFGQHVAGQNAGALFSVPAQELVRFRVPKGGTATERDWFKRWDDAYDTLSPEAQKGCTTSRSGRLVALKNNPIWQALGDGAGGYDDTLGNPWAPFAFNSGMGLIGVLRSDAIALGILEENDRVQPDTSFDLNENLQASVSKFSAGLQDALRGGGLQVTDGVLHIAGAHNPIARAKNRLGTIRRYLQEAQ